MPGHCERRWELTLSSTGYRKLAFPGAGGAARANRGTSRFRALHPPIQPQHAYRRGVAVAALVARETLRLRPGGEAHQADGVADSVGVGAWPAPSSVVARPYGYAL